MAESKVVTFTPTILKRFKKEVASAQRQGCNTLLFDHLEFDVGYAKYLIEYFDGKWNRRPRG